MKRLWIPTAVAVFMLFILSGCGKDDATAPMAKEYSATMVSQSAGQTITMQIYMKPDSLFEIPSGYKKMTLPGMPGGFKIPGMGTR